MSTPETITALLEQADIYMRRCYAFGSGAMPGPRESAIIVEQLASALREREAALQRAREERDALLEALRKVRGHTTYVNPTMELLSGLLQSIERITDTALASLDGGTAG